MTPLDILIMAAGKGTRMKSRLPKVLQRLAGRPLLQHVLDQAAHLQARSAIVITGHGAIEVEAASAGKQRAVGTFDPQFELKFVRQEPQLGTGHAVQQALPQLRTDGTVVILSGDVPLTQPETLRALIAASEGVIDDLHEGALALLTVTLPDPTGYGRIVRNADGAIQGIVEHKDASEAQRAITEVYSGILAVPARLLAPWLGRLTNDNAQGEFYLTDIVAMAVQDGVPVLAHRITDALQVAGVNSPVQLAELERAHQLRQAHALMEQGVRLADPARFDLRDDRRSGARRSCETARKNSSCAARSAANSARSCCTSAAVSAAAPAAVSVMVMVWAVWRGAPSSPTPPACPAPRPTRPPARFW